MIELHDHQLDMVKRTREAMRAHRSVILRSATGSGKTVCAAYIVASAIAKERSVIFTVHRRELIKQTMDTFDMFDLQYGVIAAGYRADFLQPIQIASIDTLKRRLEYVAEPDLIIIDECSHAASEGWAKVVEHYDKAKILGLSATPRRLDGRPLGKLFTAIVHGPEVKWLIANKYLAPFRAFSPNSPDLSDVKTRAGDYAVDELETAMDKPTITGDAVAHYREICLGKRAIAFATTVNHSKHIAESFNAAGIPARHIDGKMGHAERDEAIQLFRDDKIKILTNCDIISEGFDVPSMEVAILLRPTKSLSLYLQQCGRALRYVEGKTAFILDHASNILTHGLPTDQFEWTLEGRSKKKKSKNEVAAKVCKKCFCAYDPKEPKCPNCGHVEPVKERKDIKHVDGKLGEIDQDNWLKNAPYKEVVKKAKTYNDFVSIGRARGYKKGWAKIALGEKNEKRERMQQMSSRKELD